jgi:hypothetical protein
MTLISQIGPNNCRPGFNEWTASPDLNGKPGPQTIVAQPDMLFLIIG